MKSCPICEARCFDDMDVCYGCMHHFDAYASAGPLPETGGILQLHSMQQGYATGEARPCEAKEPEHFTMLRSRSQPRHAASIPESINQDTRRIPQRREAGSANTIRLPVIAEGAAMGPEGLKAAYHLIISLEPA